MALASKKLFIDKNFNNILDKKLIYLDSFFLLNYYKN